MQMQMQMPPRTLPQVLTLLLPEHGGQIWHKLYFLFGASMRVNFVFLERKIRSRRACDPSIRRRGYARGVIGGIKTHTSFSFPSPWHDRIYSLIKTRRQADCVIGFFLSIAVHARLLFFPGLHSAHVHGQPVPNPPVEQHALAALLCIGSLASTPQIGRVLVGLFGRGIPLQSSYNWVRWCKGICFKTAKKEG